jgi:predicted flap endonuclease-1-like 5' DNA nuclease
MLNGNGETNMDLIREYWWLIVVLVALVLAFILLRPRQRVQLTDSAPIRPHMAHANRPEGRGLAGEAAAATSDVTGELLGAPVRRELSGGKKPGDDFCRMKGVGPKFGSALHGLGFHRFEQLAHLTATEIERLDAQLGAFSGRITRDRVVEQAAYLARKDIDGYEQRFGKL